MASLQINNDLSLVAPAGGDIHLIVIREFDSSMNLVKREEFFHRDFDRATELIALYLKRLAAYGRGDKLRGYSYFEIWMGRVQGNSHSEPSPEAIEEVRETFDPY